MDRFYDEFIARNAGFISPVVQERIRNCRLLIAGCGLGSTMAEAAVRLGFTRLILADPDEVSLSNLNRQSFSSGDLGKNKAAALWERLLHIQPSLDLEVVVSGLRPGNVEACVAGSDLVIDTVDFQALHDLLGVHDAADRLNRPVITSFATGWGAIAVFFPPDRRHTLRRWLGLEGRTIPPDTKAPEFLLPLFRVFQESLPRSSAEAILRAFQLMEDGRPCPAPQIAIGSLCAAALVMTMAVRFLAGDSLREAPEWHAVNLVSGGA